MRALRIVPLLLCLAPGVALAQDGFTGTWKLQTSSEKFGGKPDTYLLKDGVFTCASCTPAYTLPADGASHAVGGSPYYDHMSITVVNPNTLHMVRTKDGRVTGEATETISADGDTAVFAFTDMTNPTPVKGSFTETRVGPAPAGAMPVSGQWMQSGFDANEAGMLATFAVHDGTVAFSTPSGQSYRVKLNGPTGPFIGDPGTTAVSVSSPAPNVLVERDYRGDKLTAVSTMTLSPDGRTVHLASEDKLHGSTSDFTWVKQ